MKSEENDIGQQVIRLRINGLEDDGEETVCMFLKDKIEDKLFHEMTLKGINEITKVTFTKYEASKYYPVQRSIFEEEIRVQTDELEKQKIIID
jgi:hypothetical protein